MMLLVQIGACPGAWIPSRGEGWEVIRRLFRQRNSWVATLLQPPRLHEHCFCAIQGVDVQVFADKRYQRHDKRDKLPGWITSHLKDAHLNLSTDMLMHIAREFMRSMAQPYDGLAIGKSLLTEAQANALSPVAAM